MNWWLASPDGMKKAQLIEALNGIPKAYFGAEWAGRETTTNVERRALIRIAQRTRRDERLREALRPPPFIGIRASEVNAWLRSLPPFRP